MATEVQLSALVGSLLGESGASVPDSTIIAGMDDFVRRLETSYPDGLLALERNVAITENPTTIKYASPTIAVFSETGRLPRVADIALQSSRYSLLNDRGASECFYLVGTSLYVYPYVSSKAYTLRNVSYSSTSGTIVWAPIYNMPLALICAYFTLYGRYNKQIQEIITDASVTLRGHEFPAIPPLPSAPVVPNSSVSAALGTDDVEIASGWVQAGQLILSEHQANHTRWLSGMQFSLDSYNASVGAYGLQTENLRSRIETAKATFGSMMNLLNQYLSYFGSVGASNESR